MSILSSHSSDKHAIGVIGAGAWGTAIAQAVARTGRHVTLWAREAEVVTSIQAIQQNTLFLPNISLHNHIYATSDMEALIRCRMLFLVSPAQHMNATCIQLARLGLSQRIPLVICSKGIEQKTLRLMHTIVQEIFPNPIFVLSGPTFASEVAQGLPVTVTLAGEEGKPRDLVQHTLQQQSFQVIPWDDITGAQVAGAMKNVIAIASGMLQGAALGENAVAACITQGLDEIRRMIIALGGKAETLLQPCGVEDVMLTCFSQTSRNTSFGYALGSGETIDAVMKTRINVTEGMTTSQSLVALANKLALHLPVCDAVAEFLNGNISLKQSLQRITESV